MNSVNIYRVRLIQSQRYAINISAPSAELAEFFAEEIRKRAGTAPLEAIGEPFSGDWQSEEICSANTPTSSPPSPMRLSSSGAAAPAGPSRKVWPTLLPAPRRKPACHDRRVASGRWRPVANHELVARGWCQVDCNPSVAVVQALRHDPLTASAQFPPQTHSLFSRSFTVSCTIYPIERRPIVRRTLCTRCLFCVKGSVLHALAPHRRSRKVCSAIAWRSLCLAAATQWAAAMLGYQPALGAPALDLLGLKLYAPWKLFVLVAGLRRPGARRVRPRRRRCRLRRVSQRRARHRGSRPAGRP